MSASIETDAYLPHAPEKVWRALTDPDLLAAWLMPNDFQPVVGHHFTFRTEPVPSQGFDGIVRCQVLDLTPPELLHISWTGGPGLHTTVTWRLAREGRGTRLFLTHAGFDDTDPARQAVMTILGGGWRGHLTSRLQTLLERSR